jgi:hypothetical protein
MRSAWACRGRCRRVVGHGRLRLHKQTTTTCLYSTNGRMVRRAEGHGPQHVRRTSACRLTTGPFVEDPSMTRQPYLRYLIFCEQSPVGQCNRRCANKDGGPPSLPRARLRRVGPPPRTPDASPVTHLWWRSCAASPRTRNTLPPFLVLRKCVYMLCPIYVEAC